jgi:hypothetical protein
MTTTAMTRAAHSSLIRRKPLRPRQDVEGEFLSPRKPRLPSQRVAEHHLADRERIS